MSFRDAPLIASPSRVMLSSVHVSPHVSQSRDDDISWSMFTPTAAALLNQRFVVRPDVHRASVAASLRTETLRTETVWNRVEEELTQDTVTMCADTTIQLSSIDEVCDDDEAKSLALSDDEPRPAFSGADVDSAQPLDARDQILESSTVVANEWERPPRPSKQHSNGAAVQSPVSSVSPPSSVSSTELIECGKHTDLKNDDNDLSDLQRELSIRMRQLAHEADLWFLDEVEQGLVAKTATNTTSRSAVEAAQNHCDASTQSTITSDSYSYSHYRSSPRRQVTQRRAATVRSLKSTAASTEGLKAGGIMEPAPCAGTVKLAVRDPGLSSIDVSNDDKVFFSRIMQSSRKLQTIQAALGKPHEELTKPVSPPSMPKGRSKEVLLEESKVVVAPSVRVKPKQQKQLPQHLALTSANQLGKSAPLTTHLRVSSWSVVPPAVPATRLSNIESKRPTETRQRASLPELKRGENLITASPRTSMLKVAPPHETVSPNPVVKLEDETSPPIMDVSAMTAAASQHQVGGAARGESSSTARSIEYHDDEEAEDHILAQTDDSAKGRGAGREMDELSFGSDSASSGIQFEECDD